MHTKAKMPIGHPSDDIQSVVRSDILESRGEA